MGLLFLFWVEPSFPHQDGRGPHDRKRDARTRDRAGSDDRADGGVRGGRPAQARHDQFRGRTRGPSPHPIRQQGEQLLRRPAAARLHPGHQSRSTFPGHGEESGALGG